jgi:hypothetical protein
VTPPNAAHRDSAGQWWATYRGHYLLAVTATEAAETGGPDNREHDEKFDAVLAKRAGGAPITLTLWKPPLPVGTYDRLVAVEGMFRNVVLERPDGALVTADVDYVDLVIEHWHHWRAEGDTFDMVTQEQMGDIKSAIRFRCGDRVFAYLMPVVDRGLVKTGGVS